MDSLFESVLSTLRTNLSSRWESKAWKIIKVAGDVGVTWTFLVDSPNFRAILFHLAENSIRICSLES